MKTFTNNCCIIESDQAGTVTLCPTETQQAFKTLSLSQKNKEARKELISIQKEENHSGVEVEDIKRTNSREYLKCDDEILLSNQISSKSSLSKTFNHNKNNPVIKGIKAEKNEEENTNKEKYIITHTKNQHSWSVNFEEQKEGDRQFSRTTKERDSKNIDDNDLFENQSNKAANNAASNEKLKYSPLKEINNLTGFPKDSGLKESKSNQPYSLAKVLDFDVHKESSDPFRINSDENKEIEKSIEKDKNQHNQKHDINVKEFQIDNSHSNDAKVKENSKTIDADKESNRSSTSELKIIIKPMKKNGFNWPYHPFQISSWIAYIIGAVVYYIIIFPCLLSLNPVAFIILTCFYFVLNIFVMMYAISAMKCNPTDRNVILTRKLLSSGIDPDKGNFKHYCEVCDSYVNERTKHCGECNRCVELFDHHCKWLNNCIGAKNYKTFLVLILLVGIQALYFTTTGIIYLSIAFLESCSRKGRGCALCDGPGSAGAIITMIIVIITAFISLVILIGVILLIKLHLKLMHFDFTTYEYIQYLDERKDRVYKLKHKKITKEKFNELEKNARDKQFKKRSKIIKEVNDDNNDEIFQKIIRNKNIIAERDKILDEESKGNNQTSSLIKNPQAKNQNLDTECNNKEIHSEQNSSSHNEHIIMDHNKAKEYLYDDNIRKKNSFWCSSTFCIPCTKKVPDTITSNISQNNLPRKRPSALQAQEYVLKDDNRYNKTTMNDNTNSLKGRTVKTEGNDKSREEVKLKDYATGSLPKDNEKIHLIIKDEGENFIGSKRINTFENFSSNK